MNIVIISGSLRPESQSLKVSRWLRDHLNNLECETTLLDLNSLALPPFTTEQIETDAEKTLLNALDKAEGIVLVSPEWDGMMSHGIASMFHYVDRELAHKPIMIAGVSSGRGGHYPLLQMRIMGHKNKHYIITPESLLVQGVKDLFNDHDMSESAPDFSVKQRADYALRILIEYAKALKIVRSSGVVDFDTFPNGV